jgi:RPN1 N-terminal domain
VWGTICCCLFILFLPLIYTFPRFPPVSCIFQTKARESLQFKLAALKDYALIRTSMMVVDDNTVTTAPTEEEEEEEDHFTSWGHEFVRSISGEIGQEYNHRVLHQNADPESDDDFTDLLYMVQQIVPFHIHHNAEAEAIDLLMEVQRLKLLLSLSDPTTPTTAKKVVVDANNYQRICMYLIKAADYMSDPDDLTVRVESSVNASSPPSFTNLCFHSVVFIYRKC